MKSMKNKLAFKLFGTIGTERTTSPPPLGATPRLSIFSSKPSAGTPNCFNIGKVVDRKVSIDGSFESFVIPEKSYFKPYDNKQMHKIFEFTFDYKEIKGFNIQKL